MRHRGEKGRRHDDGIDRGSIRVYGHVLFAFVFDQELDRDIFFSLLDLKERDIAVSVRHEQHVADRIGRFLRAVSDLNDGVRIDFVLGCGLAHGSFGLLRFGLFLAAPSAAGQKRGNHKRKEDQSNSSFHGRSPFGFYTIIRSRPCAVNDAKRNGGSSNEDPPSPVRFSYSCTGRIRRPLLLSTGIACA